MNWRRSFVFRTVLLVRANLSTLKCLGERDEANVVPEFFLRRFVLALLACNSASQMFGQGISAQEVNSAMIRNAELYLFGP